jgi:hypothetical protein
MIDQDELVQLQTERDRLLSMIAYHNGPAHRMSSGFRTPVWFAVIAIGVICGIGALILAGIFAGQISSSGILFSVVGLLLLAYILTRKIVLPAGEPEVRQRLADCEARIMKLQEGRS